MMVVLKSGPARCERRGRDPRRFSPMDSPKRTCSIQDCEKATGTRGWCKMHYARWQRHGDPLAGRNRMKVSGACSIEGCDKAMKTRGWCAMHYARWLKTGSTASQAPTLAQRFWPKVVVMGEDECWEWMGQRGAGGYGYLYAGDGAGASPRRAHRVTYELIHGPIPSGLLVCHRCDNPPCCNPAHLFLGTHVDNTADMMAKGRHRWDLYKNGRRC